MPRRAESPQGEGPLIDFSRSLESFLGRVKDIESGQRRLRELIREHAMPSEKRLLNGLVRSSGVPEGYVRDGVSRLVRRKLFEGRSSNRCDEAAFAEPGDVRVLEFNFVGEGFSPSGVSFGANSPTTIPGAEILHSFSFTRQSGGEEDRPFYCRVVGMSDTLCDFRMEPRSMGDNTDVIFSIRGYSSTCPDTGLLAIAKGNGRVSWAQGWVVDAFPDMVARAVT